MPKHKAAPPKPAVRHAKVEDATALADLEIVFPEEDRSTAQDLRRLFAGNTTVLKVDLDGAPAAAAIIFYRRGSRIARLYSLGVATHARGRGFAQALIDAACKDAAKHDCNRVRLEVREGNREAIRLYEDAGFCAYGAKSGFYPDGEDAVLMMKFLHGINDRQVAAAR
jgi:ribosomal protein S18 acetylase RimI-like enzyme